MATLGARIADAWQVLRGKATTHQWDVVLLFENLADNEMLGIPVLREGYPDYVPQFGVPPNEETPRFAVGMVRDGPQITVGLRARGGYNFIVNGAVWNGHRLTTGEVVNFYDGLLFRFHGLVDKTGLQRVEATIP
ncbi:MAG: hypothetical protein Q8N84_01270 [bacterium]|nr:hypothetical protein [bacterium]